MSMSAQEIASRFSSPLKGDNIIAVVSAKHGSGKTWVSISLAQALSNLKYKVLLFDASGGLNNIKKQLGMNTSPDLDKVIYKGNSLNQIITPYNKGRFDVVLSNSKSVGLSTMSIGCLQIFSDDLNIVARNYEKTILDVDISSIDAYNVLTGIAKTIIVVCSDTISSISDSCGIIRELGGRCQQTNISVIINQVSDYVHGNRAYNSLAAGCSQFCKKIPPLLGIIRDDTRVRDSIRNQTTILNRYPFSEASCDINAVAQAIIKNNIKG